MTVDRSPGELVGYLPVVHLEQTDTHPWWICQCDSCQADRHLFCEPVPEDCVAAAKSLSDRLITKGDANRVALAVIRGGRKW